ncbi:MAG: hypothetical protein RL335_474 [Bacteroidota bacterium]
MRCCFYLLISAIFALGCRSSFTPTPVRWSQYPITESQAKDTPMLAYLQPFRDSLDKSMNVVLGKVGKKMDIKRPVSTLGNFMSDACLEMAREKFDAGADISLVRFGGIRRPYIDAGDITRSMIFEVMPFDNLLVLVDVNGETLKRFIEELGKEGAGIAGFTMTITADMKVKDIKISGKPIDPTAIYTVAYSDYNYSNSPILKEGKLRVTTYLIRDALEDYVQRLKSKGETIGENLENRIYVHK